MKFAESETLELKKSTAALKEAVVSIASMLNKHGRGEIYFGVRNDGAVVGQDVSARTIRDVSRVISENIEPRIYPNVEKVRLRAKTCIKVSFSGNEAPYLAFGRGYMRVGDEDRQLSARELERMFLARSREGARWEAEPSRLRLAKVNEKLLRSFVNRANAVGRIDFKFSSVKGTLHKLHLLSGGKLLKAGEVLFCDENSVEVQAAVFAGTTKRTFLDIKLFKGTIFDLLEKAETYVHEHMNWRVEFGGLQRKEIPEIPVDALREALVNSLCHRDYRNPKGNEVAIFKNRVEIYNPGPFPEGYRPEDFLTGEEHSILRNPLIAEVLFKSKEIERWGSGLKRISDECAGRGVEVNFKVLKSGFAVVFHRPAQADFIPSSEAEARNKTRIKTGKKTGQQVREDILRAMRGKPRSTTRELSELLGISQKRVQWHIRVLKEAGRLKRVGSKKAGYWQVQ
jgi:ATP-dependent DNA helicase RecG